MAVRAERPALVARAERLARVLDEREPVPVADRAQLVELARIAVDVDRDDRLRPRRDRRLDRRRVEVERPRVDVREDRRRALVHRAVRRRDERVRRRDHLVARARRRRGACRDAARPSPTRPRRSTARSTASASSCSNRGPVGPSESRPERSTSSTSSSSRSSIHGRGERDAPRRRAHARAASCSGRARATATSGRSTPRTVSRYAFWSSRVIVADADLVVVDRPHRRHLGRRAAHEHLVGEVQVGADQRLLEHRRSRGRAAIWMIESRVIPCRIPVERSGV